MPRFASFAASALLGGALIALGVLGLLTAALLLRHRWPETRSAALRFLRR